MVIWDFLDDLLKKSFIFSPHIMNWQINRDYALSFFIKSRPF